MWGVFNGGAGAEAGEQALRAAEGNVYLGRVAVLGSIARGAGAASVEIALQIGLRQRDAGRHAIDDPPKRQPV